MNSKPMLYWAIAFNLLLTACGDAGSPSLPGGELAPADAALEMETGSNGGRLLRDGDFTLELAIFETGIPPEYRAWASLDGTPLAPEAVDLRVTLTRLGGTIDNISFAPQGNLLRGDTVIYEPHSFAVMVSARHNGTTHTWQYDSFEGRTTIEPAVSEALNISTAVAGPAVMQESITVYGRIAINTEQVRTISARFDGRIEAVHVSIGESVAAGAPLAEVESNQSLESYTITAPIDGIVSTRNGGPGEQTNGRELFTIMNASTVWAELSVFPADLPRVTLGAPVTITSTIADQTVTGTVGMIHPVAGANQAVAVRVVLDNADGRLLPGTWVTAQIATAEFEVPLAVRREALQAFRDFTVVYAQIGNDYEVRMLELGRQSGEWAEVLGGLAPGTRYVSGNSYILKADIEKSGAAHDH